ncbi:CHASE2 domain-containing protein [uncultured Marinobacter sp.]|uniref:CHASE2 domain-containing protein n=1 Tax=uncultured Marinobacter sp. TaxID=187379 RepID=UPI0026204D7D|nr:CHASE2 domain-containing protein [uncultured Marinobacter sp.]
MTLDWMPIKTTPLTLGLPLLAILLFLQATSFPQRIDYWLYDTQITSSPAPVDDDVVIIAIDEKSLDRLGRWPWPRDTHARLIEKLDEAGAETIVFDILFPEPSTGDPDLAAAMKRHGRVILPLHLSPPSHNYLISEQLPTSSLAAAASALGHAHVELDEDGVARGLYLLNGLGDELWPSLAVAASDRQRYIDSPSGNVAPPAFMNVRKHYRAIPMAGRGGTLPTYSYTEVLEAPPSPALFKGKTIFVGATAPGFGDILPTPFSGLNRPMAGVEFHANSYSALTNDELIKRLPQEASLAIAVVVIVLLSLVLPRMRPARSLGLCLAVAIVLIVSYTALLHSAEVWLPVSHALLMPLLACPLASALRLAMTNRFLNRQLDDLARGPQINLPEPSRRHPTQLLEHLQALLQPEGWWLSEGSEVYSTCRLTADDVPTLEPGQWIHAGNQSWISMRRCGRDYTLGLLLPNDISREAIQRYLRRLSLASEGTNLKPTQPRENISARIERVRLATDRMNNMQQFIRRSFERMPDGIIVTDELGVIRFANGHIEEWFQEPMPSLSGLPLTRLLEGHDPRETPPWHETVSETLTLNQSRTVDLRIREKDFLIHFAPFSLPESQQNGIIANISDISELRAQQRQHREAIDFISHDVRSPLVSQLALIEQLKRNPGHIEPAQLEQLGRLARRSYHLAEEFVQLARAEQLTETRFYECEFLAIVENARDSVSEQAAEKGIQLVLQGTEDLWLRGNAELLERAVINLLTNAVQYSPSGSTVNIQVFLAGHQACLTVSDEGSGIAPDELPHLFDRYRRQKSSELSGNRGTGLGLSFVNVVVEKHRGEISVSSEIGEGSAFTIKLPVTNPLGHS